MDIPPDVDLDPALQLKKKGSKAPLVIVVLLVAGGGGAAAYLANQQRNERKLHAAFMESFADVEKNDVGKFWGCVLGQNVDVGMIPDNLALSARIESAFYSDTKNYPSKVREE